MTHDFNQIFHDYVQFALSGHEAVGKWQRLAVERYLRDLANQKYRFEIESGIKWCRFCTILTHQTGSQFAGQPFMPEPWQVFVICNLFGWKNVATGYRRFRDAYVEIPRKNGKSFLASVIGLGGMLIDREASAQIYSAATTRDQARIVFEESKKIVKSNSELSRHLSTGRDSIFSKSGFSYFKPLSSDAKTMDGLNVHMAVIDELHAHKTPDIVDLIGTARGARKQPLVFEITTAGSNKGTICYKHHELTKKVLQGIVDLDEWFGIIFTIDEEDDWKDELAWKRANPNLFVSKEIDYMRSEFNKALAMPSHVNTFQRLDLNVWTGSVTRWITDEDWQRCYEDYSIQDFKGCDAVISVDLASVSDTNAVTVAIMRDGTIYTFNYFFVPEQTKYKRYELDNIDYPEWVDSGEVIQTVLPSRDDATIIRHILNLREFVRIRTVVMDRWQSEDIGFALESEGLEVFAFGQGYKSMNYPTKELERMVASNQIKHNGNRCMRWQISNIMITRDAADNIKIDKAKSTDKVDGPVSLVMALGALLELNRQPTNVNYVW